MKSPGDCTSLQEIRAIIDELDEQIISLFGIRFRYVKEVVRFKNNKTEIVAKERFDHVIAHRRILAEQNGISPDIMEKIYRLLLNYFIEEEYKVLEAKKKDLSK